MVRSLGRCFEKQIDNNVWKSLIRFGCLAFVRQKKNYIRGKKVFGCEKAEQTAERNWILLLMKQKWTKL